MSDNSNFSDRFSRNSEMNELYDQIRFLQSKLNDLMALNATYAKMIKDCQRLIDILEKQRDHSLYEK